MKLKTSRQSIVITLISLVLAACSGGGGDDDVSNHPLSLSFQGVWTTYCIYDEDLSAYGKDFAKIEGGNISILFVTFTDPDCKTAAGIFIQGDGSYRFGDELTTVDGTTATELDIQLTIGGEVYDFKEIIYFDNNTFMFGEYNDELRPTDLDKEFVYFRSEEDEPGDDLLGDFSVNLSNELYSSYDVTVFIDPQNDQNIDELDVQYHWFLNNEATGHTTAFLPGNVGELGDRVGVVVSVSDGENTKHFHIDSSAFVKEPINISAVGLPEATPFGEKLEFTIFAEDTRQVAQPVELAYGPSSMMIDGSGNVAWTPLDVMFTTEQTFKFGFVSNGEVKEYSVLVSDASRSFPIARSGLDTGDQNYSMWIDDYDGDGSNEILTIDKDNLIYQIGYKDGDYVQEWLYPFGLPGAGKVMFGLPGTGKIRHVVSADIHNDGTPDIIVSTPQAIYTIADRNTIAEVFLEFDNDRTIFSIAVDDIDGDGTLELAILRVKYTNAGVGELSVYNLNSGELKFSMLLDESGSEIVIGNVDADPALEIVVAGGYVIDGATGATEWYREFQFVHSSQDVLAVGDIDADGIDEIIGAVDYKVAVYSAVSKSKLWEFGDARACAINSINIDDDLQDELVVSWCSGPDQSVHIFDGSTGVAVEQYSIEPAVDQLEIAGATSLAVGDVDSDGEIELIWGNGKNTSAPDSFMVAELGGSPSISWSSQDPIDMLHFSAAGWSSIGGHEDRAIYFVPYASYETSYTTSGQYIVQMNERGDTFVSGLISPDSEGNYGSRAEVIDYDKDGASEVLVLTGKGALLALDVDTYAIESDPDARGESPDRETDQMVTGDFNADGFSDVVSATGRTVSASDLYNNTSLWSFEAFEEGEPGRIEDIAVHDFNVDGVLEILVASSSELSIWRNIDGTFSKGITVNKRCKRVVVGELIKGTSSIICTSGTAFAVFDINLMLQADYVFPFAITDILIEDSSFDRKNILLATTKNIRQIDPYTGKEIWSGPDLLGGIPPQSLRYAPDLGANKRLMFATKDAMYLTQ